MKWRRMRLSIRAQLLLLVLVVLLPVTALVVWDAEHDYVTAQEGSYATARTLATDTAARLSLLLRDNEAMLARLARRPLIRALDPNKCDPAIGEYARMHPELTTLAVHDLAGNSVCALRAAVGEPLALEPWFAAAVRAGQFKASDAVQDRPGGRWVSVLSYPIRDAAARICGLVVVRLDLLQFNQRLFEATAADAIVPVLDRQDRFLLRSVDPQVWIGQPLPGPQMLVVQGMSQGVFSARDLHGVMRLYAAVTMPGTGWRIFAGLPETQVLADFHGHMMQTIPIGIAIVLLALAMAWRVSSSISVPIRELAGAAEKAGSGDTTARAHVGGPTEVEYVARQFNKLLDTQQRQREERAALASHYDRLIQLARDIFVLLDPQGRIVEANAAAVACYGYRADELVGMNIRQLRAPPAQDGAEQHWAASGTDTGVQFETVHRRKDGGSFAVEVSSRGVDIEGKLYRQSFIRDITERKRAEAALQESEERFRSMLEQNISAMFMIEGGVLTYTNRRLGDILGYPVEELLGKPLLELLTEPDRAGITDALGQLLAARMKTLEREFSALRKDASVVEISVHAVRATLQGKKVILGIAQDIGERKKTQAEIERYIGRLEQSMQSTLAAVSLMVETRDPYTAGHERRVGELAAAIGTEMGLSEDTVRGLRLTGYVHDIGKIGVPAELLVKPTRLSAIEFALIKVHAQVGYDILRHVDFPWPLAQVILQHHERLDGSGYPAQLKGSEIILEARVMAVADVVEAMSSHRPYRPSLGVPAALAEIENNAGTFYEPLAVQACLRLFRDKAYVLPA